MSRGVVALPPAIAAALEQAFGRRAHSGAAAALSERYRRGATSAAGPVVQTAAELAAYAVTRFPATYAAAVAVFDACAVADPAFAPRSVLDVGSGLGATAAAALAVWPSLTQVTCVEPDARAAAVGSAVVAAAGPAGATATWVRAEVGRATGPTDLVTAGYVLNELSEPLATAARWWAAARQVLVVIEPGRAEAYRRLLAVRAQLLTAGARTLAPCPHDDRCPLQRNDWCHFGQRLPRTAQHRQAKGGALPYEDEKFSYLAMSRTTARISPRVIRRPARRKGLVDLTLCTPDGIVPTVIPKSAVTYPAAKDVGWGDTWPPAGP